MRQLCLAVALVLGLIALGCAPMTRHSSSGGGAHEQRQAELLRLHRLAEQGSAEAQFGLGVTYENDPELEPPQKYIKAMSWYRRAANQGHAEAQFSIGLMYETGQGVAKDPYEAAEWYQRAAKQGHRSAQAFYDKAVEQGYARGVQIKKAPASAPVPPDSTDTIGRRSETPFTVKATVKRIQEGLSVLGYDPGPVDGIEGTKTRAAIRDFQKDHNLPVTGEASDEVEMALRAVVAGRAKFVRREPEIPKLTKYSTASGFIVTSKGHVLTNEHVVGDCREVRLPINVTARLVARDEENDLALLQQEGESRSPATFGQGRGVRPGDSVVVAGYPLQRFLSSDLNITTGTVSALAGPGNDRRFLQITAPVQKGNSGGPLLDLAGNVAGVVVSKLDWLTVAGLTGDIPQNVNFAISAWTVRAFLEAYNVPYETAPPEPRLTASEVAAEAQGYTVLVECWR